MTPLYILLVIYIPSLLITGSMKWAIYQDDKKKKKDISMEDKVLNLYIIPLCPILNTYTAFDIICKKIG